VTLLQTHSHTVDSVLDVACGTGNVMVEVAKVFREASVVGIDISQGMVEVAKEKVVQEGLVNCFFEVSDIEQKVFQEKYSVITCAYVLFFLPNPVEVLQKLYGALEEGGLLIFTTFTPNAFQPAQKVLMTLLEAEGVVFPEKSKEEAYKELKTKADIDYLCQQAGVEGVEVVTRPIRYPMALDAWWALNNDAGYRGFLMQLDSETYKRVKEAYYQAMQPHCDASGSVELVADTHFSMVKK
jgi:2-polyprenyl-3-methyl-5-hydroxy-6-metoxy-1,4-benzoquinol methylase